MTAGGSSGKVKTALLIALWTYAGAVAMAFTVVFALTGMGSEYKMCIRDSVILVPEKDIDIDHVCALLKYNYDHGKHYGVVVVAEGCHLPEVGQVIGSAQVDSFGHARLSGIGEALAELIEKKTGFETRSVNLGHTQRGGVPTAFDRTLGQRYGLHAIDMVHDKKWGRIAVLKGTDLSLIHI